MKFTVAAAALISLVPAVLGLTINTPGSVVQCQPVLLTWSGGTPPYYLSLIPAGQVSAPALETFPTQNGTQLTWTVDQQQGASFNIALKDSTGAVAYSDIVTVQPSSDKTCIGSSSNVSAPPNTGGSSPTNTGTGNPSNSSPTSGSGGSSTKSSPTPSSSGSTSGSTSDATGLSLSGFGIAGVVGAIAALF
ncbi:hypothetical protein BJ322DRAFT_1039267 [Thelephora terrestris]|uniref:Ser-Thr-rich glycosyl-phosphatidyl-inositol-anchored membrane family-domain-containing protein n=1 Tax=Thelephora terrestris TaxID=56493 RepID=A0A9P6HNK1_9AGAM|nr:hypothetical protein BJ322DRAFT_1039267 [Thelephora terrestris]